MVRADLTVIRMADRCRLVDGADAGPRDFHYMKPRRARTRVSTSPSPTSRRNTSPSASGGRMPARLCRRWSRIRPGSSPENFPFAAIKPIRIGGKDVTAFRISYVGEQGWELHMRYEDGLAVWDALRSTGVTAVRRRDLRQLAPHGKEPAPAERRPAHRIQSASRPTSHRPKVKEADFRGKAKHLEHRARPHQSAQCSARWRSTENTDSAGVKRYPVGTSPILDPATRRDAGRLARPPLLHDLDGLRPDRSARTIALAYLPAREGGEGQCVRDRIFRRTLSGEGRRRRLRAALRSGEPEAAELTPASCERQLHPCSVGALDAPAVGGLAIRAVVPLRFEVESPQPTHSAINSLQASAPRQVSPGTVRLRPVGAFSFWDAECSMECDFFCAASACPPTDKVTPNAMRVARIMFCGIVDPPPVEPAGCRYCRSVVAGDMKVQSRRIHAIVSGACYQADAQSADATLCPHDACGCRRTLRWNRFRCRAGRYRARDFAEGSTSPPPSLSMSPFELDIQRDGYAAALSA